MNCIHLLRPIQFLIKKVRRLKLQTWKTLTSNSTQLLPKKTKILPHRITPFLLPLIQRIILNYSNLFRAGNPPENLFPTDPTKPSVVQRRRKGQSSLGIPFQRRAYIKPPSFNPGPCSLLPVRSDGWSQDKLRTAELRIVNIQSEGSQSIPLYPSLVECHTFPRGSSTSETASYLEKFCSNRTPGKARQMLGIMSVGHQWLAARDGNNLAIRLPIHG